MLASSPVWHIGRLLHHDAGSRPGHPPSIHSRPTCCPPGCPPSLLKSC